MIDRLSEVLRIMTDLSFEEEFNFIIHSPSSFIHSLQSEIEMAVD